jgi:hypothetical protein
VASITRNLVAYYADQLKSLEFLTAIITCQRHEFGDIMAVLNKKCSRLVGVGLTRIHIAISLAIPPLSSPFMVHSMQIAVFKMMSVCIATHLI